MSDAMGEKGRGNSDGAAPPLALTTKLSEVEGITQVQARLLATLGLTNVGRLIAHLPLRHESIEAETAIADLAADQLVTARGEVTATRIVRAAARPRFEAVLMDETGRLDLVWFNQTYLADKVVPGVRIRVHGKTKRRGPGLQMANAKLEVLNPVKDEPTLAGARIRPVYPANEQINSYAIEKTMQKVLPAALPLLDDHLPHEYLQERSMPGLSEAYRMQHLPANADEAAIARRRLAYDELFLLQLGVHMKRAHLRNSMKSPALKWTPAIDKHIRERFPYTLTESQDAVIAEIAKDLSSPTPTNRLIQGDVGAGKTVVALYAMLMAVAGGHQASLMAPTEILAEQHFLSISRMLEGSKVRVRLLTGATPRPEREAVLDALAGGDVDLLIGTHALISESVRFKSLAVAIIDEQHRFGVTQRATLRAQGTDAKTTPHVLVMTATPIPRTMAITLFGDLDISVIKGLPPGRKPIATSVVASADRLAVYQEVAKRIERGEQAYIVVPAIEPTVVSSEAEGKAALVDVRTVLRGLQEGLLKEHRIAAMHGQLSRETREAVMERFRLGQIKAIVATTVIEVGVDVANATVMVVEQADRFGLAQLHQLRGRVGRGSAASSCYLIADPTTPEGEARLRVMESTSDGFVLSEKDLEIRGPGEVFGLKQSGLPPFKVADLMRDRELLAMARRDAAAWIGKSPNLTRPEETVLRRRLLKQYGETLGLGDVG